MTAGEISDSVTDSMEARVSQQNPPYSSVSFAWMEDAMSRAASGGLFQAHKNLVLVTVVSEKESGLVEIPAAGIGIKK